MNLRLSLEMLASSLMALLLASSAEAVLLRGPSDAPSGELYRKCAAAMNLAWKAQRNNVCGQDALTGASRMKEHAQECQKLRWGDDYAASYGELLGDFDKWCGKPKCGQNGCLHGTCARQASFPFDPVCTCEQKWSGKSCDAPSCNPPCSNGACSEKKCLCDRGWMGATCSAAVCKDGCSNGGRCVGPNRCQCLTGWKDLPGGRCEQPVCEGGCQNGGQCTRPGICECVQNLVRLEKDNGTTVLEGFSGPRCEQGPNYWFGSQCTSCVGTGGHWCLKDGICVKGSDPSKQICPKSTSMLLDGFTPMVIHDNGSPCRAEYRKCVEVAAPVQHWVVHDDAVLGGVCGGAVRGLLEEMQSSVGKCGGVQLQAGGNMYETIYAKAVAKHAAACGPEPAAAAAKTT